METQTLQQPPITTAFKQENGMVPYWDHPDFRIIENNPKNMTFVESERAGREFYRQFRTSRDMNVLQIIAKLECARVDDILAVGKSYGFSPSATRSTLSQLFEKGFLQKFQTLIGSDIDDPINNMKMEKVVYTLSYPAWMMIRNHFPSFKTQNPVIFWNQDATRGYMDPQMSMKRYTQLNHVFRVLWETGRLRNWEWRKTLYIGDGRMPTEGPLAIADIDTDPMEQIKVRTMNKIKSRYEDTSKEDREADDVMSPQLQLIFGISQNQNKRIYMDFWEKVTKFDRTYKKHKYMPIDKRSDFKEQAGTMPLLMWLVSSKEMMENIIKATESNPRFSFESLSIPFAFLVSEWINDEDGASKAVFRFNPQKKKWERIVFEMFKLDIERNLIHKVVETVETELQYEQDKIDHERYIQARNNTLGAMTERKELTAAEQQRLKYTFENIDIWS